MNNKLEHVPNALKQAADAGVGLSLISTWIIVLTPLLEFSVLLMAMVWGYFRIQDMRLSVKIKKRKLRRHEDV